MAPIRVGLMGLSTSSPSAWAVTAHLPFLTSPSAEPHFQITAICNSTLSSAQNAISHYKLPDSTKAYSDPSDLAADPNVDLVVCAVNVATHYHLISPAITAGKDVFVEWPLASNLAQAKELAELAEKHGVRTIVGLQGRVEPLVGMIRGVVDSGKIGRVLTVTVTAAAGQMGGTMPEMLRYFSDVKTGGSIVTIHFGHFIDLMQLSLGEIKSFQSLLATQRRTFDIIDPKTKEATAVPNNTSDNIALHGFLETGALFSVAIRGDSQFDPSEPALRWNIYGSDGEIEITGPMFLQMSTGVKMRVKSGSGEIETMEVPAGGLPQNVGSLYESYRKNDGKAATFKDAVKRHEFLEELFAGKLGEPVIAASRGL